MGMPRIELSSEAKPLPPPLQARLLAPVKEQEPTPPKPVAKPAPSRPKPDPVAAVRPHPAIPLEKPPSPGLVPQEVPPLYAGDPTPSSSPPVSYPYRSVMLVYKLFYGKDAAWVGEVKHSWQQVDDHYVAETSIEAVGLAALFYGKSLVQRSEGRLVAEGLRPVLYSQRESGKREERVDFDWAQGNAYLSRGSKAAQAVSQGTQDVVSLLHQFYFMQPLQENNIIYVATPRRVDMHIVQVLGKEDLDLPIGTVRSLHLKRVEPDGTQIEMWVDQDRSLLPVRIYTLSRKGAILDYQLQSMEAITGKD